MRHKRHSESKRAARPRRLLEQLEHRLLFSASPIGVMPLLDQIDGFLAELSSVGPTSRSEVCPVEALRSQLGSDQLQGDGVEAPMALVVYAGESRSVEAQAWLQLESETLNRWHSELPMTTEWCLLSGPGSAEFNDPTATDPQVKFDQSGTYFVQVSAVHAGVTLEEEFKVEVTPDLTAPTITSRTPVPAATAVELNTTVSISFSEAMNSATINTSTIRLRAEGATADVQAAVNYSGKTVTLLPNGPLEAATTYHITVSGTVTDLAGNPLQMDNTWMFTTTTASASFTDSFQGPLPNGWRNEWESAFDVNSVVNVHDEGIPSAPGGGTQVYRQWWDGTNETGSWSTAGGLYLGFDQVNGLADRIGRIADGATSDRMTFEYSTYYDANFDWGNSSGVKQLIFRNEANSPELYICLQWTRGVYWILFQQTTDTGVLVSNVNGPAFEMPKGEWVNFKWEIKVSPQFIPDGNGGWIPNPNIDGSVKGYINGELRWNYENIATIHKGTYTSLTINPTFNGRIDGPNQKRYWDNFSISDRIEAGRSEGHDPIPTGPTASRPTDVAPIESNGNSTSIMMYAPLSTTVIVKALNNSETASSPVGHTSCNELARGEVAVDSVCHFGDDNESRSLGDSRLPRAGSVRELAFLVTPNSVRQELNKSNVSALDQDRILRMTGCDQDVILNHNRRALPTSWDNPRLTASVLLGDLSETIAAAPIFLDNFAAFGRNATQLESSFRRYLYFQAAYTWAKLPGALQFTARIDQSDEDDSSNPDSSYSSSSDSTISQHGNVTYTPYS